MSIDSIESILFRKNFLKQSIGSNFHTAEILGDRGGQPKKGVFAKQAERCRTSVDSSASCNAREPSAILLFDGHQLLYDFAVIKSSQAPVTAVSPCYSPGRSLSRALSAILNRNYLLTCWEFFCCCSFQKSAGSRAVTVDFMPKLYSSLHSLLTAA